MDGVFVLGCRVDGVSRSEAVRRIVELARGSSASLVVTLGTEMVMRAQRDERFRSVVNKAALSLCDTAGIEFAALLQGRRIQRIPGVELIDDLCAALAREGLPLYLIGGRGETAARAAAELSRRHGGLVIAGARDGYFAASEDDAVAQRIAESGGAVVLVGLGSPRQELWITESLARSGARVGIGVGGSFDILAGNVLRATLWWRRLNLEWLYRLVREPSRWRRQLVLPQFALLVLLERSGLRRGSHA